MRLLVLIVLLCAFGMQAQAACGLQTGIAAKQRIANTLRWTTASEQDNFGYHVYRGTSETGPFERISARAVPGNGTTDETHSYSYRDDSIDPCKSYWYYVESISTHGQRERFTPVFKAPAKRGPNAPAAAASTTAPKQTLIYSEFAAGHGWLAAHHARKCVMQRSRVRTCAGLGASD